MCRRDRQELDRFFGSAGSFLARLPSRSRNPRRSKAIQLDRVWIVFWIGIWIASWIAAESTTLTLTIVYVRLSLRNIQLEIETDAQFNWLASLKTRIHGELLLPDNI